MLSPNITQSQFNRWRPHTHTRARTHARANTDRQTDRHTETHRENIQRRRERRKNAFSSTVKNNVILMKNSCTVRITCLLSESRRFKTPCSSVLMSVCRLRTEIINLARMLE